MACAHVGLEKQLVVVGFAGRGILLPIWLAPNIAHVCRSRRQLPKCVDTLWLRYYRRVSSVYVGIFICIGRIARLFPFDDGKRDGRVGDCVDDIDKGHIGDDACEEIGADP